MIVCPELKLLVNHARKTGGSSVLAALLPWAECKVKNPLPVGAHGWQTQWHPGGHMHAKLSTIPGVQEKLSDGWRLASTIRNPWGRVESMYAYWGGGRPFEAFCLSIPSSPERIFPVADQVRPYVVDHWIRMEYMQEDISTLIGIPTVVSEQNKRPTPRRSDIYTEETVEIVRDLYAEDIHPAGIEVPYLPPDLSP